MSMRILACLAIASLDVAGCATTTPMDERPQILAIPFASAHSDIAFTMTTGARLDKACDENTNCPTQSDRDAATRFGLQVQRVAGALQLGAQYLYPDLARRVPGMAGNRFDVYVVDADEPGSDSSASGKIALNASLGTHPPYDEWLAFIIAREMGHVIAHHHEENSSAGIATSIIMNILIPGSGLLKSMASAGGSGIAARSKRDVQLLEADAISLKLLQAAGYRLSDVSLSLRIAPALIDDGRWSRHFKLSSDNLFAEVRNGELKLASATREPQNEQETTWDAVK